MGGARFCSARPGIYYARMRFAWGRDAQILHHDHFLQGVMKGIYKNPLMGVPDRRVKVNTQNCDTCTQNDHKN